MSMLWRSFLSPTSAVHYCYILRCSDDSLYVGVAEDPERRCREHNDGKGADWTARRRPVELVWSEAHPSLASARTRENQLKRWSHSKKLALVRGSPRLRSGQA
jgi:putative endonuclease